MVKNVAENNGAGNMNLSSDYRRIQYPNYGEAKNITWFTNESGEGFTVKPLDGNSFSFEIPDVFTSNLVYTITQSVDGINYIFNLFDANQNVIVSVAAGLNWQEFKDALVAALDAIPFAYTFTDNGTSFIIELFEILCYPYVIECTDVTVEITQEAVDYWAAGRQQIIGWHQILDRTYIFSTTVEQQIPTIQITGFFDYGGVCGVDVPIPSYLLNQQFMVKITGTDSGTATVDGLWMADASLDPTNGIVLLGSVYDASLVAGTMDVGLIGYGQIGVFDGVNYTKLLGSTELKWSVEHQMDCDGEPFTATKDVLYPTDNYNNPYVFYLNYPAVDNGGLTLYGGQYDYGTILEETLIWQNNGARLSVSSVENTGGKVLSGSYRATICFATDSGTETECLPLTNPIPIYKASLADRYSVLGDLKPVETSKRIIFTVTNIDPTVFKYVILKVVHYVGSTSVQGYRVKQVLIDGQTELDIEYNGLEQATEDLDVGEILFVGTGTIYDRAKNVRLLNDNLIYSNLTSKPITDLSAFARTLRHRIMKKTFDLNTSFAHSHQNPMNCVDYTGYMLNETYRFAMVGRLRSTGQFINFGFWIDDICVDTNQLVNIGNVNTPTDNRRDAGDYLTYDISNDIASGSVSEYYIPYIEFSGGDMSFLIDGVPIKKVLSEIWIVRAECIPEVLAMGLAERVEANNGSFVDYTIDGTNIVTQNGSIIGITFNEPAIIPTEYQHYLSFYSPDLYVPNSPNLPLYATFYNMGNVRMNFVALASTGSAPNSMHVFNGYTGQSTIIQSATISEIQYADTGFATYINSNTYSNKLAFTTVGTLDHANLYECAVLYSDDVIDESGLYPTTGVGQSICRFGQLFSDLGRGAKYDDITKNKYLHTNAVIRLDDITTGQIEYGQLQVFGGDTFIGSAYYKLRVMDESNPTNTHGSQISVRAITHTRINQSLRSVAFDGQLLYPQNTSGIDYTDSTQPEEFSYNSAYSVFGSNAIDYKHAYDPNIETITNNQTTKIWSNQRQRGSLIDDHRIFPPLQFAIDEFKHGEIIHMDEQNGELITYQPKAIKRQYFNTNNILVTQDNTEIILGNSQQMRANPDKRTMYGSYHKWGCGRGESDGGKDVLYSIDTGSKEIIRQGKDGTKVISEIQGISEWFKKHIEFAHGFDNPAFNAGINFVWDSQNKWAIWTIKGFSMNAELWNEEQEYSYGQYVTYNGLVYVWTIVGSYTAIRPDLTLTSIPNGWIRVQPDLGYSIVFDENNNGFKCFVSPMPKIYLKWLDNYYSPSYYGADTNKVYQHNYGAPLTWYDGNLTEEGYIDFIDNRDPSVLKKYTNVAVNSLIKPIQIDLFNETQTTSISQSDFSGIKEMWFAPIGNEIVNSGDTNQSNNSAIIDTYLRMRFYFAPLATQYLLSLFTKKTTLSRSFKQV